ncbi:hypothetical protein CONCODRAFT_12362 [Conidiobolus coronatus NRRL 28638]|uniref:Uncharacterized protein n=1 Tax=Conidiobolus coronatus (strain ATCC 28846 / CBS 209.66 / NRRL 28638) TaxID=796925 RepID=A0A137NT56_CONC2|nr:hypothetical protein CONCODRAFT_12362 [Conidiobolus coronatus NRRL 28638]|eukprot:KXN65921.1 hypothetical protein CONCODRAFT_12362 [Conidiobolus coronatus NRRL 28638]
MEDSRVNGYILPKFSDYYDTVGSNYTIGNYCTHLPLYGVSAPNFIADNPSTISELITTRVWKHERILTPEHNAKYEWSSKKAVKLDVYKFPIVSPLGKNYTGARFTVLLANIDRLYQNFYTSFTPFQSRAGGKELTNALDIDAQGDSNIYVLSKFVPTYTICISHGKICSLSETEICGLLVFITHLL